MYIHSEMAKRIKERARNQGIAIKDMLSDLDLGINAISEFAKGKHISCITLARIADHLNCSVDYLLCRTDIPEKIIMSPDDKRKALQTRLAALPESRLKSVEDFLAFIAMQDE